MKSITKEVKIKFLYVLTFFFQFIMTNVERKLLIKVLSIILIFFSMI